MVNKPSFEERTIQQWVMSSAKPSAAKDNGRHKYDCRVFHDDRYPPRKATAEEMKTIRPCRMCVGTPEPITRKCPTHHIVLSVSGTCDECDQQ